MRLCSLAWSVDCSSTTNLFSSSGSSRTVEIFRLVDKVPPLSKWHCCSLQPPEPSLLVKCFPEVRVLMLQLCWYSGLLPAEMLENFTSWWVVPGVGSSDVVLSSVVLFNSPYCTCRLRPPCLSRWSNCSLMSRIDKGCCFIMWFVMGAGRPPKSTCGIHKVGFHGLAIKYT